MSQNIHHQDWTTVILTKKPEKSVSNNTLRSGSFGTRTKQNPDAQRLSKIEGETETFKVVKVSSSTGKEIQKGRLAKKMTQKQLAQAINVAPKVINEFESGKAVKNEAVKRKIANYLKIKI
jgi:putative transcription factor